MKRNSLYILASLLGLFLFYQLFLGIGFQLYLSYTVHQAGYVLNYESIHSDGQSFTLNHPEIKFGSSLGKLEASKIHFTYHLHPFSREIDLDIALDEPQIELYQGDLNLEAFLQHFTSSSSWLKLNGRLSNKKGVVKLGTLREPIAYNFSIDHSWGRSGTQGFYKIHDLEDQENSLFEIKYNAQEGYLFSSDLNIAILADLMHALFPSTRDITFNTGSLDGRFEFKLDNWGFKEGKGELLLKGVSATHAKSRLCCEIAEILLNMDEEKSDLAALHFLGGKIYFSGEHDDLIRDLKGIVKWNHEGEIALVSDGIWQAERKNSYASLNILTNIQEGSSDIKLQLDHLGLAAFTTNIEFEANSLFSENYLLNFLFNHVTEREFNFAQKLLDRTFPELNPFDYTSGTLEAKGTLEISENQLKCIHVTALDADNVKIQFKPWELLLAVNHIDGNFSLDLTSNKTIDALLNIHGGQIAFTNPELRIWNFTDIETTLNVQQGILNPSSASVNLAGLKGKAEIQGTSQEDLIHIVLDGKLEDLKPFISERLQKGIQGDLSKDSLNLKARIGKTALGIEVNGTVATISKQSFDSPSLKFGFAIEKAHQRIPEEAYKKWEIVTSHLTDHLATHAPAKQLLPSLLAAEQWKEEVGYAGFKLTKGWFQINDLPLNKFLNSFLFPDLTMKLSGVSSLVGTFSTTGMEVDYIAKDLQLENESLVIEVPQTLSSHHAFNFSSLNHFGFIPIIKGSYFDKNSGLLFTDIDTLVLLENEKFYVDHLTTYCQGLYLGGNIEVDYSQPEECNIKIVADTLEGNFTQAQHFLAHFKGMDSLSKIPLEGNLNFGQKGALLTFKIVPEGYDIQTIIDCSLTDGAMESPHADLFLRELEFNLFYDHHASQLALSNLQGLLLMGSSTTLEEFNVTADQILFTNLEKKESTFEIKLNHAEHTFGKIVGTTKAGPQSPDAMQFVFDLNRTHLGSFKPSCFEFSLTNWDRLDHFKLGGNLHLSSFLQDLRKLAPAKISFLSDDLIEELKRIMPSKGELSFGLNFEGENETLGFKLEGKQLAILDLQFKDFLLKGSKRRERYVIDQFQLDDLSLSAELIEQQNGWDVNFLGLRLGEGLLLGMDGQFNKKLDIQGNVHLFEINLSELPSWKIFEKLKHNYNVKGVLKGAGSIALNRNKAKEWSLTADFETNTKNLSFMNYPIQDAEKIKLNFASGEGWSVENFQTQIGFHDKKESIAIALAGLYYYNDTDSYSLKNGAFTIPHGRLSWVSHYLNHCFPNSFDQPILQTIETLKNEGNLSGNLSFDLFPEDLNLLLTFADDQYYLFGSTHPLKESQLKLNNDELIFNTLYTINQQPFWISSKHPLGKTDQGILYLSDPAQDLEESSLSIHWKKDLNNGLVIEKAEGNLAGLSVNLKENPLRSRNAFTHHLMGTVFLNGNKIRPLLPEILGKAFSALNIGNGYSLEGDFDIGKEKELDEDLDFRFFGNLSGNELELKGYRFKTLNAQVVFEPGLLQFLDMTLADAGGTFHIGNLQIYKSNEDWYLHAPLLTAYDIRPSLLREVEQPTPLKRKPLVVRQFVLQDIMGNLADSTTLRAHGTLYFINPQKKNLQNTIFAIPAEILTRIGLNLSVLNPVNGTIQFELSNGLIYLTKFKDVYSDNKISKFHLPSSGAPSTIDLDGNINVQVRFKQSTILLKLAELFTIQIRGNIQKPTYSLQRQKYLMKEEVFSSTHEPNENEVIR